MTDVEAHSYLQRKGTRVEQAVGTRAIGLQRLQVFDQIRFLRVRESESQDAVVVLDDIRERRGAAVMEIRWVPRQGPERRGPVLMVLQPTRAHRIHARFRWIVQYTEIHVREGHRRQV